MLTFSGRSADILGIGPVHFPGSWCQCTSPFPSPSLLDIKWVAVVVLAAGGSMKELRIAQNAKIAVVRPPLL